ncbi:hypothetical protein N752_23930 [Desulforamulus aquiferis]|nr:hypothetical protein [Desulforamulus aquiferis]RYD02384.1 hypothetical protein N752_23930 [Desulforamulus aquiferis]
MLGHLNYIKDAGTTNLLTHVKLSSKQNEAPLFSKFYTVTTLKRESNVIKRFKSFLKLIN